ncbi:hypothetical protein TNCV_109731 [Trichonephila clavipes]|nr:hypothetical protein TNCV_109731 [Trichonephila clavipes]
MSWTPCCLPHICGKFLHERSLENAGNAVTSELTREMGIQRADSKRGGRRSRAEKKSDENSGRIRTHHSLFTRQTCRSLSTTKYQRVL